LKIEKEPRTEFCTICVGDYIEIVNNNPELNKPPSVEMTVLLDSKGWYPNLLLVCIMQIEEFVLIERYF